MKKGMKITVRRVKKSFWALMIYLSNILKIFKISKFFKFPKFFKFSKFSKFFKFANFSNFKISGRQHCSWADGAWKGFQIKIYIMIFQLPIECNNRIIIYESRLQSVIDWFTHSSDIGAIRWLKWHKHILSTKCQNSCKARYIRRFYGPTFLWIELQIWI